MPYKKAQLYDLTEAQIEKRIQEGRGSGEYEDYLPWHQLMDTPSQAPSTRYFGITNRRLHHVFSLKELYTLAIFDWSDLVVDCREQYPLSRNITIDIAADLDVRHPYSQNTGCTWVMTTDFVLTVQTPDGLSLKAIAFKELSDLEDPYTQIKLEIERICWEKHWGYPWQLVTDRNLLQPFATNVLKIARRIHESEERGLTDEIIDEVIAYVEPEIRRGQSPLRDITNDSDNYFDLDAGQSLAAVYLMLASKQWFINMHEEIDTSRPMRLLS